MLVPHFLPFYTSSNFLATLPVAGRLLGKIADIQKGLSEADDALNDAYSKGMVDGFTKE